MYFESQATAEVNPENVQRSTEARNQIDAFLVKYPHDPLLLAGVLQRTAPKAIWRWSAGCSVPDESVNDHVFWFYRGWYLARHQKLGEAEAALQESLRLSPLSWLTRYELASLLRQQELMDAVAPVQQLAIQGRELYSEVIRMETAPTFRPKCWSGWGTMPQDAAMQKSLSAAATQRADVRDRIHDRADDTPLS